jgi:hypothetical protein
MNMPLFMTAFLANKLIDPVRVSFAARDSLDFGVNGPLRTFDDPEKFFTTPTRLFAHTTVSWQPGSLRMFGK